jgi:hypothetical protein
MKIQDSETNALSRQACVYVLADDALAIPDQLRMNPKDVPRPIAKFRLVGLHAHALSTGDGHESALLQSLGLDDTRTLGSVDPDLVPDDGPVLDREVLLRGRSRLDELEVTRDFRGLVGEETSLVAGHPAGHKRLCVLATNGPASRKLQPKTHLFFQKALSLLALISATRFIALMVVWTNSLLYLTGTFRRFSNSNVES